jgi:hypothetical protein
MAIDGIELLLGRRVYPAMTPVESEIVRKWLRVNRDRYERVEFNVRLGAGMELDESTDDSVRAIALLATQKRADVVAWNGLDPTIIEIKPRVGFSALGQLLGYRWLWKTTYPEQRQPALLAVGETAVSETAALFAAHGVALELVPTT